MDAARTRSLLNAIPLPALLIGSDRRISVMNTPASVLLGSGLEGLPYFTVLRQRSLASAVDRCFEGQSPAEGQYVTSEAARDVNYRVTCATIGNGETADILVSFEDRSAQDEAGIMRRDFVANVSHELRTPLTALLSFIETLQGAARDDAEARDKFLAIMEGEAARMNRLVSDLLSLSRVEEGERIRPTEILDLTALLHRVVQSLGPLALEQKVELKLDIQTTPAIITGDPDQLQQVFANLIENGIKYSGIAGNVTVSLTEIDRDAALRTAAYQIEVTDKGEGIDEIHLPRLTERFYRVDSHRSRQMGGTGLGLAIVKHIVSRHRGRMSITSVKGEGSRFSVYLPRDSNGNDTTAATEAKPKAD